MSNSPEVLFRHYRALIARSPNALGCYVWFRILARFHRVAEELAGFRVRAREASFRICPAIRVKSILDSF
jgi:hypothetical protein